MVRENLQSGSWSFRKCAIWAWIKVDGGCGKRRGADLLASYLKCFRRGFRGRLVAITVTSSKESCSVCSCYLAFWVSFWRTVLLVQTPERFGLMQRLLFPKRPLSHAVIYVSSRKFFCYPHANLLSARVELWFLKSSSVRAVSKHGEQLDCCLSICTNSQFVLLTVTGHRACFECKHSLCLGAGRADLW